MKGESAKHDVSENTGKVHRVRQGNLLSLVTMRRLRGVKVEIR